MGTPAPDQYVKKSPPAWYPDPADNRGYRYWDGWAWTNHFTPRPMEWGPGVDVTYDPPRLPVARLTAGGYEPVVYVWRGDGEQLTPEQAGAAAELERRYRLEQRCDSWWSAPMTRAWAPCLFLVALALRGGRNWFALPAMVASGVITLAVALLLLGCVLIVRRSRLLRSRKLAWTVSLSWVVAPRPQRRGLWRMRLLALPMLAIWAFWIVSLWRSWPRPDLSPFVAIVILAVVATAVVDAVGLRRRWWVL